MDVESWRMAVNHIHEMSTLVKELELRHGIDPRNAVSRENAMDKLRIEAYNIHSCENALELIRNILDQANRLQAGLEAVLAIERAACSAPFSGNELHLDYDRYALHLGDFAVHQSVSRTMEAMSFPLEHPPDPQASKAKAQALRRTVIPTDVDDRLDSYCGFDIDTSEKFTKSTFMVLQSVGMTDEIANVLRRRQEAAAAMRRLLRAPLQGHPREHWALS